MLDRERGAEARAETQRRNRGTLHGPLQPGQAQEVRKLSFPSLPLHGGHTTHRHQHLAWSPDPRRASGAAWHRVARVLPSLEPSRAQSTTTPRGPGKDTAACLAPMNGICALPLPWGVRTQPGRGEPCQPRTHRRGCGCVRPGARLYLQASSGKQNLPLGRLPGPRGLYGPRKQVAWE